MTKLTVGAVRADLLALADPEDAQNLQRFFKTGKGQYGEGDVFLGIRVPATRKLVAKYRSLPLAEVEKLLHSKEHEARLLALLIMVAQYKRGDEQEKQAIYDVYLANTKYINNWDLVDLSAPHIVGAQLATRNKSLLTRFAKSDSLWERRIAMLATFYFIRHDEFAEAIRIAKLLLNDRHDLIHKAVGWMLREVGQRDLAVLRAFLREYAALMPRTTLRYSIEKMAAEERVKWMRSTGATS